jgi:hypothetical protein
MISARLGTELKSYLATDSIKESDDVDSPDRLFHVDPSNLLDFYVTQTPPGLPPHELQLHVGAICRIMRNFSIDKGLVKNSRCLITSLGTHLIAIRKLTMLGNDASLDREEILIPRITFTYTLPSGHTLTRKQFPLALAYASTFNSCQGLTLDRIGIDLTRPAFSHGQLYTALSRVKKREDACLFYNPGQDSTTNVTYRELLL